MGASLFYLTQSVPKPYQLMLESATGSQINAMMVRSYLQEAHSIAKTSEVVPFQGAISLGNPGIYKNSVKVDVTSLYPSAILHYKIYDKHKDPEQNFLKIMQTFTAERIKNKQLAKTSKYHDDLQSSQKIVINSGYGFLGAPGLNYNSPSNADFVTRAGRETLQRAIEWATGSKYIA
jgi:DNA polymerase elongation subunit (family B)